MDESTPAAPPPIPKATPLAPKDHAEAVAIFRSEIVGALTRKDLDHGELRAAFRALSPSNRGLGSGGAGSRIPVFGLSMGSPRGHSGTSWAFAIAHERPSRAREARKLWARESRRRSPLPRWPSSARWPCLVAVLLFRRSL